MSERTIQTAMSCELLIMGFLLQQGGTFGSAQAYPSSFENKMPAAYFLDERSRCLLNEVGYVRRM